MRKLALLAAVVCLISCCGMNADAQTWTTGAVSTYHYVGPSKATTDGNALGIVGMNALCQASYKATAHMCNTDEFFQTAAGSKGSPITIFGMWIQPSFHECYYDTRNSYVSCRMAGVGRVEEYMWDQACTGNANWSTQSADMAGLMVYGIPTNGAGIGQSYCNESHAVACCAP